MNRTRNHDKSLNLPRLLTSIAVPLGAGALGSIPTARNIPTWYAGLKKPGFNPPNSIFAPVWTTLYLLMGVADYLVGAQAAGDAALGPARLAYRGQLALNTLWSILFFGLRAPAAALLEIGLLWVAVLLTIVRFARISRPAALLLVPYLVWVSFAAALNAAIWRLNR